MIGTIAKVGLIAIAAASLGGCAVVGTQPDGTTNVVGLAAVSVTPQRGYPPPNIRVQSLGVTISDQAPDSGIVLGYSDRQFTPQPRPPYAYGRNGQIDFVGATKVRQNYDVIEDEYAGPPPRYIKRKKRRYCRC